MCERMQWHDSKRSFLTVMETGTNLIYIFLSRPKDQKLGKVLIEGLWVGMVCKRIVWLMEQCFLFNVNADYWNNQLPFLSAISFWSDNHSVNYLRPPPFSSICCRSIAKRIATVVQLPAINLAVRAKYNKVSPQSTLSVLHPAITQPCLFGLDTHASAKHRSGFHIEDTHPKHARLISKSSLNKSSCCSCQTSPPVYLLCEFGFYGASRSIVLGFT